MLFEGGAPAGRTALGSLQGVRKAPEVSGEPEPIELFGSLRVIQPPTGFRTGPGMPAVVPPARA